MLAGAHGADSVILVQVVGQGNQDDVQLGVGQHVVVVLIGVDAMTAGPLHGTFRDVINAAENQLAGQAGVDISRRVAQETGALLDAGDGAGVAAAHAAAADDGDLQRQFAHSEYLLTLIVTVSVQRRAGRGCLPIV